MKIYQLKAFIFVISLSLSLGLSTVNSFAQDDSAADRDDNSNTTADNIDQQLQASQAQARQALNQIHALMAQMNETGKKLDALEKQVNQEAGAAPEVAPVPQEEQAPSIAPIELASEQPVPREESIRLENSASSRALPVVEIGYTPVIPLPKEQAVSVAQEDFYSSYREPGLKQTGAFYGLKLEYTSSPLDFANAPINVFHADLHGDFGRNNYDFSGDGTIKNVNNYIVEPRAWLGKNFDLNSQGVLTPYLGVGYRWHFDQLKNKFSDPEFDDGGGNVKTQYFYIPVGVQYSILPTEGWKMTMNGEYDYVAWGEVINDGVNIDAFSNDFSASKISAALRGGYGVRGSLKIVKESDPFNFFIEPYIRYWNIRSSKVVNGYVYLNGVLVAIDQVQQPKNSTTEVGASFGIEF